ncbi:uncharacterized protein METZ01_LOCUS244375 [marine metagenome]|uniref:Uncharacterized protein n=1 Tax=marine metagenome TaxID=408172 RepID=A0A382HYJ1_9ZZZZ
MKEMPLRKRNQFSSRRPFLNLPLKTSSPALLTMEYPLVSTTLLCAL